MATCLVTGASGFVGKALALKLCEEGHQVIGVSRRQVPEIESAGGRSIQFDLTKGASSLKDEIGDLTNEGLDVVFHTAAKVDIWGEYEDFYSVNVKATEQLLELSEELGVERFVYTSSPSVVSGSGNLEGVNEDYPYPNEYEAFYPLTKSLAEKKVLDFNARGRVRTVSLRPHLIFGPGDNHLIPTILDRAKRGRLFRIGDGENLTDVCYIDDCVSAHLAAFKALGCNPKAAGRAYFISQGEPIRLWEWINELLAIFSYPPVKFSVPTKVAEAVAGLSEWSSRTLFGGSRPPSFTRFLVSQMSTSHFFDISAARDELGYRPAFSVKEALQALRDSYKSQGRL